MPRYAVITGGQGGLGQAIQQELESALDVEVLAPGRAQLDVANAEAVVSYFEALNDRVVLLVNNAGITRDARLLQRGIGDWEAVMATNLKGAWRCCRAVLPGMLADGCGHIVNVSSFSAFSGPVGQASYAASKAGLLGLTQSLAAEGGPHGVRVNAVLPGFLETKMTQGLPERVLTKAREAHLLGRFNTPADVAKFIRFLHLELENVSGQIFQLDSRLRSPGW